MSPKATPWAARVLRHARVRKKVDGNASRPRLSVFRSLKHISAQVIDDGQGHTLVAASSLEPQVRTESWGKKKTEVASIVGRLIAQRSLAQGITAVVYDRGGYLYHGRAKALAEAAREAGLKF